MYVVLGVSNKPILTFGAYPATTPSSSSALGTMSQAAGSFLAAPSHAVAAFVQRLVRVATGGPVVAERVALRLTHVHQLSHIPARSPFLQPGR